MQQWIGGAGAYYRQRCQARPCANGAPRAKRDVTAKPTVENCGRFRPPQEPVRLQAVQRGRQGLRLARRHARCKTSQWNGRLDPYTKGSRQSTSGHRFRNRTGGLADDVWRVHQLQQGWTCCERRRAAGRVYSQISAYSNTPTGKRHYTHELWITDTPAALPDPCSNHCAVTPATARPCMFLIQKSHAQTNRPRRAQTPTARPAGQGRRPGCRGKRFRAQRALPTFRTLI